jgi:hypothetical protein
MLDTLAEAWAADHGGASLWADKTVKFLDPCTKSGAHRQRVAVHKVLRQHVGRGTIEVVRFIQVQIVGENFEQVRATLGVARMNVSPSPLPSGATSARASSSGAISASTFSLAHQLSARRVRFLLTWASTKFSRRPRLTRRSR